MPEYKKARKMIHYHGTPVSGTRQDVSRFLVGRHALISFYRPDDTGAVLEYCQSFILDNGAFSHWKAGKGEINFIEYHTWVQGFSGHPGMDWCLIPDRIDGTESDNVDLVTKWLRTGSKVEGVPVWHLHESLDWLEHLAKTFRTIAFGSSGEWKTPGTKGWLSRMDQAMRVVCDDRGRPIARLHGLRMLDPRIFSLFPFSSADSTNAAMNGGSVNGFGIYVPPTAGQRAQVIADRVEMHNSAAAYIRPQQAFDFCQLDRAVQK